MHYFWTRIQFISAYCIGLACLIAPSAHATDPMTQDQNCPSILKHEVTLLESSTSQSLCEFAGQTILVVNTASGCGFTPQLKGLEKLYQEYKDKGLVVLGFPSNSFFQEKLEGQEIAEFCQLKYGVSFPMTEKGAVKGDQAHPFYKNLAQLTGEAPKWNFFKYLINAQGDVVGVYPSSTSPDSLELKTAILQSL